MRYFLSVAVLIYFFLLTGCNDNITGSGRIIDKEYTLGDFSNIQVSDGCQIDIEKSDKFEVVISINDNFAEYIEAYVKSNKLFIMLKDGISYKKLEFKAKVKLPDLSLLKLSGGTVCNINSRFTQSTLDLELSNGSILTALFSTDNCSILLDKGSIINLTGTSKNTNINSNEGSIVNLINFNSNNCNVDAFAGSIVTLFVSNELKINASGGSIIKYSGPGRITGSNLSGGSQVIKF